MMRSKIGPLQESDASRHSNNQRRARRTAGPYIRVKTRNARNEQIWSAVPGNGQCFCTPEVPEAGGIISHGGSITDAHRQGGAKTKKRAMSPNPNIAIALIGIDIGKNSFHIVCLD
jgi:hypothetical protein